MNNGSGTERTAWIIPSGAWVRDEIGGAFRVASDLAVQLAARGYGVHYVAPSARVKKLESASESGVTVWRYPRPPLSGGEHRWQNFTDHINGSLAAVNAAIAQVPKDSRLVLNGHSLLQVRGAMDQTKRPFSRFTVCVPSPLVDEYLSQAPPSGLWGALRRRAVLKAFSSVEKSVYRASQQVIGYSQYTLSLLESRYPREVKGKLRLCPAYVDTDKFSNDTMPRIDARRAIDQPAWKNADIYFFSLRRLVDRMGIDTLIHAAARLKAEIARRDIPSRVRIVIGGDGPLRVPLETLADAEGVKDTVFFVGRVPEEKLALHYRAADCFILPTRSLECFGLIILESFACGTPVIATPVGSIPEVMGPFGAEGLTRQATADALYEKMLDFVLQKIYTGPEFRLREHAMGYEKRSKLLGIEEAVLGG